MINNKSQYSTAYQKNPKQSELPQVIHIKHFRFSSHGSQVFVMLISQNLLRNKSKCSLSYLWNIVKLDYLQRNHLIHVSLKWQTFFDKYFSQETNCSLIGINILHCINLGHLANAVPTQSKKRGTGQILILYNLHLNRNANW